MDTYNVKYDSLDAVALRCFQKAYPDQTTLLEQMNSRYSCSSLLSNYSKVFDAVISEPLAEQVHVDSTGYYESFDEEVILDDELQSSTDEDKLSNEGLEEQTLDREKVHESDLDEDKLSNEGSEEWSSNKKKVRESDLDEDKPTPTTKRSQRILKRQQAQSVQNPDADFDWEDDAIWNTDSSGTSPAKPPLPTLPKPKLEETKPRKKWEKPSERKWSDDWDDKPMKELMKGDVTSKEVRSTAVVQDDWDDWEEPTKTQPVSTRKEDDWDKPQPQKEDDWDDWDEPQPLKKSLADDWDKPTQSQPISTQKEDDWDDWDEPQPQRNKLRKNNLDNPKISSRNNLNEPVQSQNSVIKDNWEEPTRSQSVSTQKEDDWDDWDKPTPSQFNTTPREDDWDKPQKEDDWNDWDEPQPLKKSLADDWDKLTQSQPISTQKEDNQDKPPQAISTQPSNSHFADLFPPTHSKQEKISNYLCNIPDTSYLADTVINIVYS